MEVVMTVSVPLSAALGEGVAIAGLQLRALRYEISVGTNYEGE